WPQSTSSANFGQSEAASARDTDIEPVAPTISAKAATLDNHIVDFLVFAFLFRPRRAAESMLARGTFSCLPRVEPKFDGSLPRADCSLRHVTGLRDRCRDFA